VHQSAVGEYFNALIYARFFSGRSVQGIASVHPYVAAHSTPAERQYLKNIVDQYVTIFYGTGIAPTASLTIQSPTPGQVFAAGQNAVYQASAADTASDDLSAAIHWIDGGGAELHVGPSFSQSLPAGAYSVTARVTGSDGNPVSASRSFSVASGVNQPPVATDVSQNVIYNTPFMQISLLASDPDGTINWSALQLDASNYHGVSAQQDSQSLSSVNMNYQGTNFNGIDHFSWRVKDNAGAWSNWADAKLIVGDVLPPARPKGLRLR
jgi:methionine-rich copper-binding protein CopC